MPAVPEDPRPESRWPWFAGALVIAAYAGFYRVRTFDTFFHLAAGRWMIREGAVPRTDPFSYSFPEATWHDHAWGFQWALFRLHELGGYGGLVLAVTLATAMCFTLGAGHRGRHRPYLLPWALIPFVFFRDVLCARPHLYGLLALSAITLLLCVSHERRRPGWLWFIAPIHVAWVTMHGSHLLTIPVLCVYAAGLAVGGWTLSDGASRLSLRRQLMHLGGVIAVAGFVTLVLAPESLSLGLDHVGSAALRRYIPEWKPLSWGDLVHTWAARAALVIALLAVAGAALRWRENNDDPWTRAGFAGRLTLFVVLTVLGSSSRRMLALWLFGAMPLWLEMADPALRALGARLENLARLGPQLALVSASFLAFGAFEIADGKIFVPGLGVDERRVPVGALEYLERRPDIPFERPFHAYNYGGYIMWARPQTKVLIDGRAITVYPPAFMKRFVGIYDEPPRFDDFANEFGVDAVLLPRASSRTGALRWYLDAHPDWISIYGDRVATLWTRRESPPVTRSEEK